MWVEFVVGSWWSGFPFSSKTNISKFQFDQELVDEEPLRGRLPPNGYLFIYLFVYLFIYFSSIVTINHNNHLLVKNKKYFFVN